MNENVKTRSTGSTPLTQLYTYTHFVRMHTRHCRYTQPRTTFGYSRRPRALKTKKKIFFVQNWKKYGH